MATFFVDKGAEKLLRTHDLHAAMTLLRRTPGSVMTGPHVRWTHEGVLARLEGKRFAVCPQCKNHTAMIDWTDDGLNFNGCIACYEIYGISARGD